MKGRRSKFLGRRAAGSGGGAFLAVAMALVLVAADIPDLPSAVSGDASLVLAEIGIVMAREGAWIEQTAAAAWTLVPHEAAEPEVRARIAAGAAFEAVGARYPLAQGPIMIDLDGHNVSTPQSEPGHLPGEFCVRIVGTLRASAESAGERTEAVDLEACDPAEPRARQYLDRRLLEQTRDPRSAVASAVRQSFTDPGVLALPLPAGALEALVEAALSRAASQLEDELGAPRATGEVPAQSPAANPAPAAPEVNLSSVSPDSFAAFFRVFLEHINETPAARAFLTALHLIGGSLLDAARALLAGDEAPLRSLLLGLPSALVPPLAASSALLRLAGLTFLQELREGAERAALALRQLAPSLPSSWASGSGVGVNFRADEVRLSAAPIFPIAMTATGKLVPASAMATLTFVLESSIRLRASGGWIETSRRDPFELSFPFVGLWTPWPVPPLQTHNASRADELAAPLAASVAELEALRSALDQRLVTFRESVSRKLAQSSAGGLARLAFRVLDGLESNDSAQSARALFDLMERYFADDLATALTANVSVFGVNFTLIPDPVRQQVSLEHEEGPHTFGARVRRLYDPENPLLPKFADHLSLALELYWKYRDGPVSAGLTLDPFLRTDEGLLRFTLRVEEGDGLQLTLVAPHIVRRSGVLQVALSDFFPGGIVFAPTPFGGALAFDAGARVEFARVTVPTAVRFVLRAVEAAVFDLLENQSVGEVGDQLSVAPTARRLLDRLVNRLADTFADAASRFVLSCEFFVRLRWYEAAGAVSGTLELALSVKEPVQVFRHGLSAAAALARSSLDGLLVPDRVDASLFDFVPSALHERLGPSIKLSLHGGLDGIPLLGRALAFLPHADLEQTLFLSLGALSAAAGRRSLHWLSDYSLGFEGFALRRSEVFPFRIQQGDTLEAVKMRVESLAGPRILISEVLPSPEGSDSDLEFVELYNPAPTEEDLTGWTLSDGTGHAFRLPDGTRIGPGETVVLARGSLAFFERFAFAPQVPTLTLALNDDGDRLVLRNPRGWVSDHLAWGDFEAAGPAPKTDESILRLQARTLQPGAPWSALQFTGLASDFATGAPTPGALS